jgi:hypothetical protein
MRINLIGVSVLVAALLVIPAVRASGIDLHWLWHDRCAACHGHSADFSRKFLSVSGGTLQGHHHVHDLRRFLHTHYLAGHEVDAVYTMLLAQAGTPPRFQDECSICHDTAVDLVRDSLQLRDGVLYSRNTGRPVRRILDHHQELDRDDVEFFINVLTRVAYEIFRPQPPRKGDGRN